MACWPGRTVIVVAVLASLSAAGAVPPASAATGTPAATLTATTTATPPIPSTTTVTTSPSLSTSTTSTTTATRTASPSPPRTYACTSTYQVLAAWPGGFVAQLHAQGAPTQSPTWSLSVLFTHGEQVVWLLGGSWTQGGIRLDVTGRNAADPDRGTVADVIFVARASTGPGPLLEVALDGYGCGVN